MHYYRIGIYEYCLRTTLKDKKKKAKMTQKNVIYTGVKHGLGTDLECAVLYHLC